MTIFIIFFLPETKGIPVERIHVSGLLSRLTCRLLLPLCCCSVCAAGCGRGIARDPSAFPG